jgi:uncharacterized protein YndB with AHSA1/START domain
MSTATPAPAPTPPPPPVPDTQVHTVTIVKEVEIAAPIDLAWEAALAQLGPDNTIMDGSPYPFVFEAWPGGRWFRDLGNNSGHLWGHVQVIKPPTLIEITGPMFMSYPAMNHVQYRLVATPNGTRLTITHRAHGLMPREHREGVDKGWAHIQKRIQEIAAGLVKARQGGKGR